MLITEKFSRHAYKSYNNLSNETLYLLHKTILFVLMEASINPA